MQPPSSSRSRSRSYRNSSSRQTYEQLYHNGIKADAGAHVHHIRKEHNIYIHMHQDEHMYANV